jgi:glycosyltransferase involved in cell wall biosynthesis
MAHALRDAGFPKDKIAMIYNGVDVYRYSASHTGELRSLLGVGQETPVVGIVANIRASKGYEYFIRAARLVVDEMPGVRFVSIGDPGRELSPRMNALVSELGLEADISFLGFRDDVPSMLADFDVFVLSSLDEGFPFAAIEAMAAGLPSVMTRCGGPEEVADDGVTGYLVPVADARALADGILKLLSSPELAQRMGRAAREKIVHNFSLTGMLAQYERLYERLVSARR